MAGTLTTLQCSLINTVTPFSIKETGNLEFPMAPMASVNYDVTSGNIKIRTIVFIDSSAGTSPNILSFSSNENGNVLEIALNYNYKDETPTTFSCFYVELNYSSETVKNITEVCSHLIDTDPKTSRGTYTNVATNNS